MKSVLRSPTHPLRFLLYLEWMLLLIVAISEAGNFSPLQLPRLPLLNLLGLGMFAIMGLWPPQNRSLKVIYTSVEIGLILLLSFVGGLRLFQLLYIVLVIRNCLIFEAWQRSFITGITFLLCILVQAHRFQHFTITLPIAQSERLGLLGFSLALLLGLVVVFLQLLVTTALAERRSREQLAMANEQLRRYALKIEEIATLQERNRIAREIHDSLGHSLTVFNLHLEASLRLLQSSPEEAKDLITEAKQIGSKALQEVRQSVAALRSDPLEGRSLSAAIQALCEDFSRSTDISPTYELNVSPPISAEVKTAVYRIVQESLTNICKYAAATKVSICIQTNPDLQVIIHDNGRGFDLNHTTAGFGLQGMRERTLALGGNFQILTTPGHGCKIIANFPPANLTSKLASQPV